MGDRKFKPPFAKIKMVETDLSIEEFARHLGRTSDVAALSELHFSQAAMDTHAEIFNYSGSRLLFNEQPVTDQKDLDTKQFGTEINWGTSRTAIAEAYKRNIPIRATDVVDYESPSATRLTAFTAQYLQSPTKQYEVSLKLALEYLVEHGVSEKELGKFFENKEEASHDSFLEKYGSKLPKFHIDNLKEASEDFHREFSGGIGSTVGKFIDKKTDVWRSRRDIRERLAESDPFMADVVDKALAELKVKHATFPVGGAHIPGIEKILESKGHDVAHVAMSLTDDPKLDRHVFRNPNPRKGEPEWLVMVYDQTNLEHDRDRGDYRLERAKPQKPQDLPKAEKSRQLGE